MFKRHGIEIPRQRMCDWIGTVVEQILLFVALALKRSARSVNTSPPIEKLEQPPETPR